MYIKFNFLSGLVLSGILAVSAFPSSSVAIAQSSSTYSYDAQGRLVTVVRSNDEETHISYDAVGNIERYLVVDSPLTPPPPPNSPPTCIVSSDSFYSNAGDGYVDGLNGCTDPDGDSLTLVSLTNPQPLSLSVSVGSDGSTIIVNFAPCGASSIDRTVVDPLGNTASSTFIIFRDGNSCDGDLGFGDN